ncbi:MAG: IS200/IS605 family transposase [Anaerolineales bacterium]|nr:IS200/IS605 family transposase [Chloroflexota bacterium]MBL6981700.1 IS200/IS605 family transposase [Anaerolineales bacterium]
MPYWQLFYHIVWATKHRVPILTAETEPIIHNYLQKKAVGLGAIVFALNGWNDHVHMVVSIPPKISVAKFIGQVKAVASTKFNKSGHAIISFYWQAEYAVFSFDRKRLPNYIKYVERQKEHHQEKTTIPILERTEGEGVRLISEEVEHYLTNDIGWREELEALENGYLSSE